MSDPKPGAPAAPEGRPYEPTERLRGEVELLRLEADAEARRRGASEAEARPGAPPPPEPSRDVRPGTA